MRNEKGQFIKTHGMVFTSEYRSYTAMKKRCLNPDEEHIKYANIQICDRWIKSFQHFIDDMGRKPTTKHTIDRIDNSKGYEPSNCRWATQAQQNRNYGQNRIIEFNGRIQCITEWAEQLGIDRHRIYQRLNKGWSIEKTLTTPVKGH